MSNWLPNQEAWDKFLALLDSDPNVAGEKYEELRRRLIIYFECRRCLPAEDKADETITRLIRTIYEGASVNNLLAFAHGVARYVRLEGYAAARQEDAIRAELLRYSNVFVEPEEPDLRLQCFDKCFSELPAESQQFLIHYYKETRRAKIDNRKSLAEQLGITQNAVTLRAYHLRKKLEGCVKLCLKRQLGR
jgi:DNA-directed RNA polymerase specialized sigma24 family protein